MRPRRRRRTAVEIAKSIRDGEVLYRFEWARDKAGYVIEPSPAQDLSGENDSFLAKARAPDLIRPRGGPLDYYRPMEDHPGLWREFAERCTSPATVVEFANEYGLPGSGAHAHQHPHDQVRTYVPDIIAAAANIRHLVRLIDTKRLQEETFDFFNQNFRGLVSMRIVDGILRPVPVTLLSAMQIQAAEALTGNQIWKHCQNPSCHKSFQLGAGYTKRRQFCDDRCRQAYKRLKDATAEVSASE
jgi:hypothetical protein